MKEIPLTQGKVALVDDEDFERVSQYKWYYNNGGALRHVTKNGADTVESMSCFLYGFNSKTACPKYNDGNTLNFTKNNVVLLTASYRTQGQNYKKTKNCTSCFVGVSWYKTRKKWVVQILNKGKCYKLGYFDKELEAAAAYNKKAIELYGPNAKLNPLPLEES